MYCTCTNKKRMTNSAAGQTFEVCAKSLGGCGNEIASLANMVLVDVKLKLSEPIDFIITNMTLGKSSETKVCRKCEGAGWQMVYVSGPHPHEEKCDLCDGSGEL